jgi:hypothetical protein
MFGSLFAHSVVGKLFFKDYLDVGANQIHVDFRATGEYTLNGLESLIKLDSNEDGIVAALISRCLFAFSETNKEISAPGSTNSFAIEFLRLINRVPWQDEVSDKTMVCSF